MNTKIYIVIGILLLAIAPFSNAQRHERARPMSIKEQILVKLDSIDLVYMSRLRTRDHFEARRRLDAIAQLVDRLTDNLRERELALSDREKALQKREMALEDRERDREHLNERDRNRDRDREGDRNHDKDVVRLSPISMQEFDQLLGAVEQSSFDQDKKKIVKTSSNNNYFLVEQVIKLTSKFSFDKDKLDVIEILYPRVLDLDKNYLLYNCFTFSDSKGKLEKFMEENTRSMDNPK